MSQTFIATTTLTTINCGCCGGTYAISEKYRHNKEEQGGFWHCPYCQTDWGYAESENQKLRRELLQKDKKIAAAVAAHDQTKSELEHTERRRRAEKANATKLRKRIQGGVCPCCEKHFEDLQQHVQTEHPEFGNEPDEDAVAAKEPIEAENAG